jgi:preprotein translocase subunit SecG
MITIVTILHIFVSIGLILVVLLQTGKGADMGAVFGGSSSTIFGSSGAGNFLTRLTTGMAIIFMITSLTLGYFSGKRTATSVFDARTGQTEQAVPQGRAAPGAPPQPAPPAAVPGPQAAPQAQPPQPQSK